MNKKIRRLVMMILVGLLAGWPLAAPAQETGASGIHEAVEGEPLASVYSEEQRKTIFKEIGVAEDKAAAEVKPLYDSGRAEEGVKLQQTLQRKYVTEVLEKYNITPTQELELYTEALEQQWAAE